jgi:methyl-accepting chemotaxis protein
MLVLLGVSITGFIVFGIFTYNTVSTVKINSELYDRIREMADIDRDVNPPRVYLLQVAYDSLRLHGLMETRPEKVSERIDRIEKGIAAYEERHEYWSENLKNDDPRERELREAVVVKAHDPAEEFIKIVRQDLIPAAQKGDIQRVKQLNDGILFDKLVPHWSALTDVRAIAEKYQEEYETEAASVISSRSVYLIATAIIISGLILVIGWLIVRSIVGPLGQAVEKLKGISTGDINQTFEYSSKDELGMLADAFRSLSGYLRGIGEVTDAVAAGDLTQKVVAKSERDTLSNNLNKAIHSLESLLCESRGLIQSAQEGNINVRSDSAKFGGAYGELLDGMNGLLDAVSGRVGLIAERVEKLRGLCITNLGKATTALAEGDLKFEIITGTEFLEDKSVDAIGNLSRSVDGIITQTQGTVASFEESRAAIRGMIDETRELTEQAKEGNINFRGNETKFQGGYRELIAGINNTLKAFVEPLNEASDCLERVADRDLTAYMRGEYKGEFAKMKESLNTALANLDEGMQQIAVGAEQVTNAATEISSGSQALAQGASEQASTLEEVSSNLQEISSMTRQNASNSKEARAMSDGARTATEGGMRNMKRLSEAVERIKESSDSTAKIVKTIEEIAFQTNLLALNAAVEAARAGDAGKGFAVVAEEVRNLAMRSAEAAQNTAQLIDEAVRNTENGVALNSEVSQNLEEINTQIEKVSVVMAEIAAASEQQNQGVEQINVAVEQMNGVTQQTAANSEESASAAEELSGQAQEMLGLIGGYTLSNTSAGVRPKAASFTRSFAQKPVTVGAGSVKTSMTKKNGRKKDVQNGFGSRPSAGDSLIPFDDINDSVLGEF